MIAGLLNEVVEVLHRVSTTSDYGGDSYTWQVNRTTRARVTHSGGSVSRDGAEEFPDTIVTFEFHKYNRFSYTDRIRHKGQLYSITDIDDNRLLARVIVKTTRVNE